MSTELTMLAVMLETDDLERAGQFYDAIAHELGVERIFSWHRSITWGVRPGSGLILKRPDNDRPAGSSEGFVVCIGVASPEQVDRVFAIALEQGATAVMAPCDGGVYAASFRDLDGHKIEVSFGI